MTITPEKVKKIIENIGNSIKEDTTLHIKEIDIRKLNIKGNNSDLYKMNLKYSFILNIYNTDINIEVNFIDSFNLQFLPDGLKINQEYVGYPVVNMNDINKYKEIFGKAFLFYRYNSSLDTALFSNPIYRESSYLPEILEKTKIKQTFFDIGNDEIKEQINLYGNRKFETSMVIIPHFYEHVAINIKTGLNFEILNIEKISDYPDYCIGSEEYYNKRFWMHYFGKKINERLTDFFTQLFYRSYDKLYYVNPKDGYGVSTITFHKLISQYYKILKDENIN